MCFKFATWKFSHSLPSCAQHAVTESNFEMKTKFRSWLNEVDDLICALSCIEPRIFIVFIHFPSHFSSGKVAGAAAL